jgi:predicted MFS family arabinose efflux permease
MKSVPYLWYVVLLVTVVNACNYMDRMALAVLAPDIQADLALSDSDLGLLTGFAFALFYAICGIPMARWADRGKRRNIMALALATWSLMTAASGAAQTFWHLFLARVGVGAGEAGGTAPAGSILCDYVPLPRRPMVFAIQAFGYTAGMMLGMALAGQLAERVGWRWTFVVLGLPGLALAAIVRLTLREPPRGVFEGMRGGERAFSLGDTILLLWQCRSYRLLTLFLILNGFVQAGLTQWWPSFYVRVFDLSAASVGVSLGLAIGLGSGAGMLVGGVVATRAVQRDVRLPLQMGMATIALTLPAAAGSILAPSASGSMFCVAATLLLLGLPFGAIAANVFSVAKPQVRAMAGAVAMFATSLIGFGLGPWCVGALSDLLAPEFGARSLRYAMLLPLSGLPFMVLVLRAAARSLPQDLHAAGTQIEREPDLVEALSAATAK